MKNADEDIVANQENHFESLTAPDSVQTEIDGSLTGFQKVYLTLVFSSDYLSIILKEFSTLIYSIGSPVA